MRALCNSDVNQQAGAESAFSDPDFYPHPVGSIQVEETHISRVFLTGDFVYKVKKPVDFGFLDFTTLEKRKRYCEQEVLLNQRLSEGVYLDVVAVTQEPTGYTLNGSGKPVEYAVKMRQLPRERTMLELLRRGNLSSGMVQELVHVLTHFYEKTRRGPEIDGMGSREMIQLNIEEDFTQTEPFVATTLDKTKFARMHQAVRSFLSSRSDLLERRVQSGRIRDCHGDLRLGHIYFVDTIQIIDCIEFNDRFRYGDVAADLAFLAMDLDYNGCADIGQTLLTGYAREARDPEVFLLLDFYKCYRAHVRCKVECLRYGGGDVPKGEADAVQKRAQRYFELAYRYATCFDRQTLWIVCGLSGSGKSTIAAEMAELLNVRIHNSDVIRKKLFGLSPNQPVVAPFGESIYTVAATNQTYEQLLLEARQDLSLGKSVILDGTFGKRYHRDLAQSLAEEIGVNVILLECVCPDLLLRQRLAAREGEVSVTDARLQHLEAQRQRFEPLVELADHIHLRISTEQPLQRSLLDILSKWYILQSQQASFSRQEAEDS